MALDTHLRGDDTVFFLNISVTAMKTSFQIKTLRFNILFSILSIAISLSSYAHEDHNHDEIIIENPRIKIMPPGVTNSVGYLTIINPTESDKTLIGISSKIAEVTEIHTHSMQDGLMKMQKVSSLSIPAQTAISFEPGGYHIMLINLLQTITEGEKIEIILTFDDGTQKKVLVSATSE